MNTYEPIYNIRVFKEPNGIYDVMIIKADGHQKPMLLKVSEEYVYNIEYRDENGNLKTLENVKIDSIYTSDSSDPEYYEINLEEGNYKNLPDKLFNYEKDNMNILYIKTAGDEPTVTIEVESSTITSASVDKDIYLSKTEETTVFKYNTSDNGWDNYTTGEAVDIVEYGISIEGTPSDPSVLTATVTKGETESVEIDAASILSVTLAVSND